MAGGGATSIQQPPGRHPPRHCGINLLTGKSFTLLERRAQISHGRRFRYGQIGKGTPLPSAGAGAAHCQTAAIMCAWDGSEQRKRHNHVRGKFTNDDVINGSPTVPWITCREGYGRIEAVVVFAFRKVCWRRTKKAIKNMLAAIEQGVVTASTKERLMELEAEQVKKIPILLLEWAEIPPTWVCERDVVAW